MLDPIQRWENEGGSSRTLPPPDLPSSQERPRLLSPSTLAGEPKYSAPEQRDPAKNRQKRYVVRPLRRYVDRSDINHLVPCLIVNSLTRKNRDSQAKQNQRRKALTIHVGRRYIRGLHRVTR